MPPVVATAAYATFQHVAYSASLVVTNLEAAPIALNSMACVPVSDDTAVAPPAPVFTDMNAPLVLNAASATAIGVYVTLDQLKLPGAPWSTGSSCSTLARCRGRMGRSTPVRFSCAFRIPLTDSGLASATVPPEFAPGTWDLDAALQAVTGLATQPAAAVSKAGGLAVDPATRTVAIASAADPADSTTLARVRSARAGRADEHRAEDRRADREGNGRPAAAPPLSSCPRARDGAGRRQVRPAGPAHRRGRSGVLSRRHLRRRRGHGRRRSNWSVN